MADQAIRTAILGSTGYVAGELMRLLAGHPRLQVVAPVSRSRAGQSVSQTFPHLRAAYPSATFTDEQRLEEELTKDGSLAVFSALPHGESAPRVAQLIQSAETRRKRIFVVDLSADFRIADRSSYERTYGKPHGAPELLERFQCALPDLDRRSPQSDLIAHPGCFTTAATLGAAGLVGLDLIEPSIFVSAVTGSTGSGREPSATTHHPERHSNMRAYSPLKHRHEIEMRTLLQATQPDRSPISVAFAPHSGAFARGIHATIHARLRKPISTPDLVLKLSGFFADTPFVHVTEALPELKEVVGTNLCRIGIAVRELDVIAFSVIDNLTKGAAGGGLQWMNRLIGCAETTGLNLPGLGWN